MARGCAWLVTLLAALAHGAPARAQSTTAADRQIWSAVDAGASRGLQLAIDPTRVFLVDAVSITVVDRASGSATVVPIDLGRSVTVGSTLFADGRLWLAVGITGSPTSRRIVSVDPATGVVSERTRVHDVPTALTLVDGELYWCDTDGRHLHRIAVTGGPLRTVATAPRNMRFRVDGRIPLAVDDAYAYAVLEWTGGDPAPSPLVRIPRHGGAREVLDPDVGGRAIALDRDTGALVLSYTVGRSGERIERFDLATRTRTTLVPDATVITMSVHDGQLAWIDGNFWSEQDFRVMRVSVRGGTPEILHQGDRRHGSAIAFDARGVLALVFGHPESECVTHHAIEPGDRTFTECSGPDHQLWQITP